MHSRDIDTMFVEYYGVVLELGIRAVCRKSKRGCGIICQSIMISNSCKCNSCMLSILRCKCTREIIWIKAVNLKCLQLLLKCHQRAVSLRNP